MNLSLRVHFLNCDKDVSQNGSKKKVNKKLEELKLRTQDMKTTPLQFEDKFNSRLQLQVLYGLLQTICNGSLQPPVTLLKTTK